MSNYIQPHLIVFVEDFFGQTTISVSRMNFYAQ